MARSIGAILLGFLFIGLLSFGTDFFLRNTLMPEAYDAAGRTENLGFLVLTIVYVGVFAIAGCYLTGRLAPNRPYRHAMILGVLGLIFNIAGAAALWNTAPAWFHIVSLLLVLPYAHIGGKLAEAHSQRRVDPVHI